MVHDPARRTEEGEANEGDRERVGRPSISNARARRHDSQIFQRNYRSAADGRYVVRIPFRRGVGELGSSRDVALRRFLALERRMSREPELEKQYRRQMNELLQADHMRQVTRPPDGGCYYLPHHAVTRKFRVVFDASCKTDKGRSLNDYQLVGERLQDSLFTLLLRFRADRVAITADIKKMYLQVMVAEQHWDWQRVFWREEGEDIKEYWLTRVTFGQASAPHCAVRAMQQCAKDYAEQYPVAAEALRNRFNMDDGIMGCESEEEAMVLIDQLTMLLKEGGFEIQKVHSNCTKVMETTDASKDFSSGPDDSSVLGLRWLGKEDQRSYAWRGRTEEITPTKRGMVKDLAQIFDPMGLVGPVVVTGKRLIRDLHIKKLGWDEEEVERVADSFTRIAELKDTSLVGVSQGVRGARVCRRF